MPPRAGAKACWLSNDDYDVVLRRVFDTLGKRAAQPADPIGIA